MNWIKIASAAAVVLASITAPASAQEVYGSQDAYGPYHREPQTYFRSYDVPPGSYASRDTDEYWNERNFGFSGRDPSRAGGVTPNLRPSGS